MDLDQRLKKRYKSIKDIEFIIKESIYYRNNNCYFDDEKKIIIANTAKEENKSKIL
jgi:hypothetical protein